MIVSDYFIIAGGLLGFIALMRAAADPYDVSFGLGLLCGGAIASLLVGLLLVTGIA